MNDNAVDISAFSRCRVLVVGDLMIDEYLWGEVGRISPEAPVPVVTVRNESYTLGGAGNVVNNLVALGADVSTVGVIGTGRTGGQLLTTLREKGLDTAGIFQEPQRPTTRKARIIAGSQQVLRIDWETRQEISPATLSAMMDCLEARIPEADVVLISDYGKGLLSRPVLKNLLAIAHRHDKTTIADPKGFDFSKYAGATLLTPNRKEAAQASGIEIIDGATLADAAGSLLEKIGIENLLITCGQDGMVLFRPDREPHRIRSRARQVFDVSGAGDTVLAVLGLAVATGASLEQAAAVANTAAGVVVSKVGTATVSEAELVRAMGRNADGPAGKQKTVSELSQIAGSLREKGKRIVLTNGCFDLLHAGHVDLLAASRNLGDILVVAVDDDDSVRRVKGPGRPVIAARERVRILDAMDAVDYVVVFASEELEALIEAIRPDILTKGGNYAPEEVKGGEKVESLGGKVVLVPVSGNASSTRIIRDIRNS